MTAPVVEVAVESIAAGGDGVGRTSGLVVFVPRTAPGDVVRARIHRRKRFARGELETIVRGSPQRVDPACRHYRVDRCGGCQLQHMTYDAQLAAKAAIVRDSLQRIGKRKVDLPRVRPSAQEWRYRTKLTLAMRRAPNGWTIGLHPYDDPIAVFSLEDCPITDGRVMAVWNEVIAAAAFFPEANELRAAVRLLPNGASVAVHGGARWPAREAFFSAVPAATVVWWTPADTPRRLVAERAPTAASTSFAQINVDVARELRAYVVERAASHGAATMVDAYAGTGDTAVALAEKGIRVTAIELDGDASARCAARLPAGSTSLTGRVEDLLPDVLPTDVVLLNPPRSGLHDRVTACLQSEERAPRAVLYVSCDPGTLGRDLGRLSRYRIASVLAFDMFPQTAHVETVCELVPARGGEGE